MNERIKEIALNTNDACEHLGCSDIGEEWIEKFAELIVWECAHLVGGYTKENEFGPATDVKEAYEEITKHFGVEE